MKKDIYGFGFDFLIFSVLQEYDESRLPVSGGLRYESEAYSGKDSFAFPLCDEPGVFYNVTSAQEECGGTVFIREVEGGGRGYFCVPWQDAAKSDVRAVAVDPEYIEPLEALIREVIALSPVGKAYILMRCQCRGDVNVIGMLKTDEYIELMRSGGLLGNLAYIVYDPSEYEFNATWAAGTRSDAIHE